MNEKAGTRYKSTTAKTQSLIKSRLSEGFSVDEFKIVIDKMCGAWLGNEKMERYLRPETLFGTKFEGYLNAKLPNNNTVSANGIKIDESLNDLDDLFY